MDPIQLISLAYEALKERRLRAALTVLMVIMGASLIVALNGTGNGFSSFVDSQFRLLGANVIIVQPRSASFQMDKTFLDTLSKLEAVKDIIPYIQQTSSISSQ